MAVKLVALHFYILEVSVKV